MTNDKVLAKNGTAMIAAGVETLAVALGMDGKQRQAMLIGVVGTATQHIQKAGKLDLYNAITMRAK